MLLTIVIVITADTPKPDAVSLGLLYSLFCISLSSIILLAEAFFCLLDSGVEDNIGFVRRVKLDPGGRGTPLYKLYRYVPAKRVGFLSRFGLKMGMDFAHYGLK